MALQQRLGLQIRLSQRLVLTPSLQQAIKLLPLTTLELADVLEQEVTENGVDYELVALVVYEESHYLTYKRSTPSEDQWVVCDDGYIEPVSLQAACEVALESVVFTLYTRKPSTPSSRLCT